MKHEWKKKEKDIYLPKTEPQIIEIPKYNYFIIDGQGNPNGEEFSEAIGVLYSLSYHIKMLPKKNKTPNRYFEYSVYPLEAIWDKTEKSKKEKTLNKDELLYRLMIRQPDFVDLSLAKETIKEVGIKKPHRFLEKVKFENICDGRSIQIMHIGSYDDEPKSFEKMHLFMEENNLTRVNDTHREIYLSNAKKTAKEKLKTVLRYSIK